MRFTIYDLRFTRELLEMGHAAIWGFAFLLLGSLLVSCGRSDAQTHQQIVGTWGMEKDKSVEMTLNKEGTFYTQIGLPNSLKWIKYNGTWGIKTGFLQITLTNAYSPNNTNLEPVGSIDSFRVVSVDASRLSLEYRPPHDNPRVILLYTRK